MSLEEKVEALIPRLERALAIVEGRAGNAQPTHELAAYERPEMAADEVVADGMTVNRDGSIWGTSKGEHGPEGARYRVALGYISERKFPETYAAIRRQLGENFDAWQAGWNPYSLIKSDPRPLIFSGMLNTLNLAYILNPFTVHVQS